MFALSSSSHMGLLLLEAERRLTREPHGLFCPTAAEKPLQKHTHTSTHKNTCHIVTGEVALIPQHQDPAAAVEAI